MRTTTPPVCIACAAGSCNNCRGCLCTHSDPQVMAAQSLALTMAHFRHAFNDAGYAAVLPAFETLLASLPVPVAIPGPRAAEANAR